MRVAIVQNRIVVGGIVHVMMNMIEYFNQKGIKPDIVTLKSAYDEEGLKQLFDKEVDFSLKKIFFNTKMPYEWNLLWFNLLLRRYARNYDLIISHNNVSFLGPDIPTISYIHFPRKARAMSKWRSIHDKSAGKMHPFMAGRDPFYLARGLYSLNRKFRSNEVVMANSEFTRNEIARCYEIDSKEIIVAYPPIVKSVKGGGTWSGKRKNIMTLGRFVASKRQIEQIQIAKKLPQYHFFICGFVDDQSYLEKCRQILEDEQIENVSLYPDLESAELKKIFQNCAFFLHSVRNEPFGITAIQAVQNGCIPVVHDSGGQKETVPMADLRYQSVEEAVEKLSTLSKLHEASLESIHKELKENLDKFTEEAFYRQMERALKKLSFND
jgi:glycosyltransferase involved in cell wall biosynthesis